MASVELVNLCRAEFERPAKESVAGACIKVVVKEVIEAGLPFWLADVQLDLMYMAEEMKLRF